MSQTFVVGGEMAESLIAETTKVCSCTPNFFSLATHRMPAMSKIDTAAFVSLLSAAVVCVALRVGATARRMCGRPAILFRSTGTPDVETAFRSLKLTAHHITRSPVLEGFVGILDEMTECCELEGKCESGADRRLYYLRDVTQHYRVALHKACTEAGFDDIEMVSVEAPCNGRKTYAVRLFSTNRSARKPVLTDLTRRFPALGGGGFDNVIKIVPRGQLSVESLEEVERQENRRFPEAPLAAPTDVSVDTSAEDKRRNDVRIRLNAQCRIADAARAAALLRLSASLRPPAALQQFWDGYYERTGEVHPDEERDRVLCRQLRLQDHSADSGLSASRILATQRAAALALMEEAARDYQRFPLVGEIVEDDATDDQSSGPVTSYPGTPVLPQSASSERYDIAEDDDMAAVGRQVAVVFSDAVAADPYGAYCVAELQMLRSDPATTDDRTDDSRPVTATPRAASDITAAPTPAEQFPDAPTSPAPPPAALLPAVSVSIAPTPDPAPVPAFAGLRWADIDEDFSDVPVDAIVQVFGKPPAAPLLSTAPPTRGKRPPQAGDSDDGFHSCRDTGDAAPVMAAPQTPTVSERLWTRACDVLYHRPRAVAAASVDGVLRVVNNRRDAVVAQALGDPIPMAKYRPLAGEIVVSNKRILKVKSPEELQLLIDEKQTLMAAAESWLTAAYAGVYMACLWHKLSHLVADTATTFVVKEVAQRTTCADLDTFARRTLRCRGDARAIATHCLQRGLLIGPDRRLGVLSLLGRVLSSENALLDATSTLQSAKASRLIADLVLHYLESYAGADSVDDARLMMRTLGSLLGCEMLRPSSARAAQKAREEGLDLIEPFVQAIDTDSIACLLAVIPPGQCSVLLTFCEGIDERCQRNKSGKPGLFDAYEAKLIREQVGHALTLAHRTHFAHDRKGEVEPQESVPMEPYNKWLCGYAAAMIFLRATNFCNRMLWSRSEIPLVNFAARSNDLLALEGTSKHGGIMFSYPAFGPETNSVVLASNNAAGSTMSATGVIFKYAAPKAGPKARVAYGVAFPLDLFTTQVCNKEADYEAIVRRALAGGCVTMSRPKAGAQNVACITLPLDSVQKIVIRAARVQVKDARCAFGVVVLLVQTSGISQFLSGSNAAGFLQYSGTGKLPDLVTCSNYDRSRVKLFSHGTEVRPRENNVGLHRAPTQSGDCGSPLNIAGMFYAIHCGLRDPDAVYCNFYMALPPIQGVPEHTSVVPADPATATALEAAEEAIPLGATKLREAFFNKLAQMSVDDGVPRLTEVSTVPGPVPRPLSIHVTDRLGMVEVHGGHSEIGRASLCLAADPTPRLRDDGAVASWCAKVDYVVQRLRARFVQLGFRESVNELTSWQAMLAFPTAGSARQLIEQCRGIISFVPGSTLAQVTTQLSAYMESADAAERVAAHACVSRINTAYQAAAATLSRGSPLFVQEVAPKHEPVKITKFCAGSTRAIIYNHMAYICMLRQSHWKGDEKSAYCEFLQPGQVRRLTWDQLLALDTKHEPEAFPYLNVGRSYVNIQKRAHELYLTTTGVSADVSGWDRSLPREVVEALFKAVFPAANYQNWTRQLCGGGAYRIGNSVVKFRDPSVTLWPSGNLLTLLGNSIMHAALLIDCKVPIKKFMVQGDDLYVALKPSSLASRSGPVPAPTKEEIVRSMYAKYGLTVKQNSVDDTASALFCGCPVGDLSKSAIDPVKVLTKLLARVEDASVSTRRQQVASLVLAIPSPELRESWKQCARDLIHMTDEEYDGVKSFTVSATYGTCSNKPYPSVPVFNGVPQVCGLEGMDGAKHHSANAGTDHPDDVDEEEEADDEYADDRAQKQGDEYERRRGKLPKEKLQDENDSDSDQSETDSVIGEANELLKQRYGNTVDPINEKSERSRGLDFFDHRGGGGETALRDAAIADVKHRRTKK